VQFQGQVIAGSAGVERHDLSIAKKRDGRGSNRPLFIRSLAASPLEACLAAFGLDVPRSTAHTLNAPGIGEDEEVMACGDGRHAEFARDLCDGQPAPLLDELEDLHLAPVCRQSQVRPPELGTRRFVAARLRREAGWPEGLRT
jgi:hypothetical protein